MQPYEIDSEEASIVIVGSFNPAIFHPEWLVRHQLIPQDDLKGAKIEIVHNDVTKFALEWLSVDILRNKFVIRTNDPSKFAALKDLMISVFSILEHTPITQLGMNLSITYKINSEENWHAIGDNLAPKPIWEESLPKRVGLISLTVKSPRLDSLNGYINVNIRPVWPDFFGVNFNVNNHVELITVKDDKVFEPDVPAVLAQHWDSAIELARKICEVTIYRAITK